MRYLLLLIFITINIYAQTITATGVGQNSDKDISKQKALNNAKVMAINNARVFIKSEFEAIKHRTLDSFKKEIKQKVSQESEGLVSLIAILDTKYSKDGQIYICDIKAKFDIEQSDIKNSFEIMKKLDKLASQKANKSDIEKLQKEINYLKSQISDKSLGDIVNKNIINVINNIKVENNIDINNIINIENKTDELLYYIIGGLFLVIITLLFLNNRQKDIVVKHIIENPTIEDIADIKKQDDEIILSLEKDIFYDGERLLLNFRINSKIEEFYIYGYNIDTNDEIVLLKLLRNGDKIKSNKDYTFPDYADGYKIVSPFGDDIIKIFVSQNPIETPTISKKVKSLRFTNMKNQKGLENPTEDNISQYDIVEYFNRFSILQSSIKYTTKDKK